MSCWSFETIPWNDFALERVNPHILAFIKGASLVEANAADYVAYLQKVFVGDPRLQKEIQRWGTEEQLHGAALRRWCELADPQFDFERSMHRFLQSYRVPVEVEQSVRGTCANELVARCVVENGTTALYLALRDSTDEPVLKYLCGRIAGDEIRHFHLFLKNLNEKYAASDGLTWLGRLKTVSERILEVSDAELSFAYFAANFDSAIDLSRLNEYSRTYMREAVGLYEAKHLEVAFPMIGKVLGINMKPWLKSSLGFALHKTLQLKFAD